MDLRVLRACIDSQEDELSAMGTAFHKDAKIANEACTTGKKLKEGDMLPSVVLKGRIRISPGSDVANDFAWKNVTTEDLFKGRRIVLFSLPGGKILMRIH